MWGRERFTDRTAHLKSRTAYFNLISRHGRRFSILKRRSEESSEFAGGSSRPLRGPLSLAAGFAMNSRRQRSGDIGPDKSEIFIPIDRTVDVLDLKHMTACTSKGCFVKSYQYKATDKNSSSELRAGPSGN